MKDVRGYPSWEEMYAAERDEILPWFSLELDPDLGHALDSVGAEGGRFLDIGCGPGTQAIELRRRGFEVTGSDVSATAVARAVERAAAAGVEIAFVVDDVLASRLDGTFDHAFDRGCFHVLEPDKRPVYLATVTRLLRPGGRLFLKTFSHLEPERPDGGGPHRLTAEEVRAIFEPAFILEHHHQTEYQGQREPRPKALFCVLRRA